MPKLWNTRRRLQQQLNQAIVSDWRRGIYGKIIQEMHERLEAADPDYILWHLETYFPAQDPTTQHLSVDYMPHHLASAHDWHIMDAIVAEAEREVVKIWRHTMALAELDRDLEDIINGHEEDYDYGMDCD